jgi:hypothetical protein
VKNGNNKFYLETSDDRGGLSISSEVERPWGMTSLISGVVI